MNKDVVNEIFKRRPARDFLRLYPSDKWKEIIPDIFEIGVLNLKNSFGTLKFTKNQIKDILLDLRNYKPDNDNEEFNIDNTDNNNINIGFNNEQNNEEEYENNEEEEEEYFENNNNDIQNQNNNIRNNFNIKKEDIKERTANAEVFIPDENNMIQRKVNYNRPKIAYNSTMEEIREKNIENKRNLGYTESKIKYQIMNDKRNHQMKKRKISNDDDNDGNFSFNQKKNNIRKDKNLNKNYVINFDKNLNPQKPIEIQRNKFEYNNNLNNYDEENIFKSFKNNINNNNNENNSFNNNDNDYNIMNNNNNQNVQNHLNNYKINMLNLPKQEFYRGNFNNN